MGVQTSNHIHEVPHPKKNVIIIFHHLNPPLIILKLKHLNVPSICLSILFFKKKGININKLYQMNNQYVHLIMASNTVKAKFKKYEQLNWYCFLSSNKRF